MKLTMISKQLLDLQAQLFISERKPEEVYAMFIRLIRKANYLDFDDLTIAMSLVSAYPGRFARTMIADTKTNPPSYEEATMLAHLVSYSVLQVGMYEVPAKKPEGHEHEFCFIPSCPEDSAWITQGEFAKGNKLIDVGCGIGNVVVTWHLLTGGKPAVGIEVDAYPALIGRRHLARLDILFRGAEIIHQDAFELTELPEGVDRVYTYCPIGDEDVMKRLYHHIWRLLPPGAMWMEALDISFSEFAREVQAEIVDAGRRGPTIIRKKYE